MGAVLRFSKGYIKRDKGEQEGDKAIQYLSEKSEKIVFLILGMHRSGTSLLAGIIDGLGCEAPKTLMVKNKANPKGYFESTPIVRLNNEILAAAGSRWDDFQPLQEGWADLPAMQEFHRRATEILRDEYGDASKIYLKDPRICRLLPFWQRTLEDMGFRVICVHTHRHPDDVATSLKVRKMGSLEPCVGQLIWLQYILDAEAASRNLPRIFTSYPDLLADWRGFVERVEKAFGFAWFAPTQGVQERVDQLVDQNLQRHKSSISGFLKDEQNPKQFRETLQILEAWTHLGENSDDFARLDEIRHGFEQASQLLRGPISALLEAQDNVKALSPLKETAAPHQLKNEAPTGKLTQAENRAIKLADETKIESEKITKLNEKIRRLQKKMQQTEDAAKKRIWVEKQKRAQLAEDLLETHRSFTTSTSWKITAPIRLFARRIRGTK